MNQKVLLIEDDSSILDSLMYSLTNDGFDVITASTGASGLAAARNSHPDIVILDLMLPDRSGLDICRVLRKENDVPIIMLTAKTEEMDRIMGLELGADDYITKPFSTRELIARIRAILRRAKYPADKDDPTHLTAGDITMDLPHRNVTIGDAYIHLPLKQFDLLKLLLMHQNEVLTREYIYKTVWNSDPIYDTGTLDVHIRWLREKIEKDPAKPRFIRTIRGVGYKFVTG